jgi:hypothetical protein
VRKKGGKEASNALYGGVVFGNAFPWRRLDVCGVKHMRISDTISILI